MRKDKKGPNVCPMCGVEAKERFNLSKGDSLPAFDNTDDCNNEHYIHVVGDSKLFKLYYEESWENKD